MGGGLFVRAGYTISSRREMQIRQPNHFISWSYCSLLVDERVWIDFEPWDAGKGVRLLSISVFF